MIKGWLLVMTRKFVASSRVFNSTQKQISHQGYRRCMYNTYMYVLYILNIITSDDFIIDTKVASSAVHIVQVNSHTWWTAIAVEPAADLVCTFLFTTTWLREEYPDRKKDEFCLFCHFRIYRFEMKCNARSNEYLCREGYWSCVSNITKAILFTYSMVSMINCTCKVHTIAIIITQCNVGLDWGLWGIWLINA